MNSVLRKAIVGISLVGFVILCGAACTTQNHLVTPSPVSNSADASDAAVAVSDEASVDAAPVVMPVVVQEDNWQFTLPSADWKPMPGAPANLNRALLNDSKKNLVLFVKEEFKGNCKSPECAFMQYALLAIKDLRDAGGHLESAKSVQISGHQAVLLQALSDSRSSRVWNWITFYNGYGYVLSCAGSSVDETQRDLCLSIGNSIKIN